MPRFDSAQRLKILDAAIGVFAEHGLDGAAIRLVGNAAGVNSALIYYYFENKRSLFIESLQLVVRGLLDHLSSQRHPFVSAHDRLSCLVNALYDYFGKHPDRMKLMVVSLTLHPEHVGKVIESLAREGLPLPLDILKEGMEINQLRDINPLQAWWCILGACMFNMHMQQLAPRLSLPSSIPLPESAPARHKTIQLLCEGLAIKSAAEERGNTKL